MVERVPLDCCAWLRCCADSRRAASWAAWKFRSGYCQGEFGAFHDDQRKLQRPTKPYKEAWGAVRMRAGKLLRQAAVRK